MKICKECGYMDLEDNENCEQCGAINTMETAEITKDDLIDFAANS